MRVIKFLSVFFLVLAFFTSCEKLEPDKIVFYSKDQLIENLAVKINNTDGILVSVNSNTIISLNSSEYFKANLAHLKDLSVPKMCFKLKNYQTNPSTILSNINVFVDEIQITNEMGQDFLKTINNNTSVCKRMRYRNV
jgi:hypothetical protein